MAKQERVRIIEAKVNADGDYEEVEDFEVGGEISIVDAAANRQRFLLIKSEDGEVEKMTWTGAYVNDLPDSSFAIVEGGGDKDADGKTVPRSLRHLPYKDADGKVDLPHLRNALARLPQTDLSPALKDKARGVLEAAAKTQDVGAAAQKQNIQGGQMDGGMTDEKGMLKKMFDMLTGFFKGGGKAEKEADAEVFLPAKPKPEEEQISTKEGNMPEPEKQQDQKAAPPDAPDMTKVIEELKAAIVQRDERIQALEDARLVTEKAAKGARVEAIIDRFMAEGKVSAAARDYLRVALLGEEMTLKSKDGGETLLTTEEALKRFVETNRPVRYGEISKAAGSEDLGRYGGKTAAQYAEEKMKQTGKVT